MFFKKSGGNSARERDKARLETSNKKEKKVKAEKKQQSRVHKRKIPRTVIQTLPYEQFVSEYVMLVKSNIKIGKQVSNLYSKSFLVPDINYSSLPEAEQEKKLLAYVDLLNGFDSSSSIQMTMHNTKINRREFEERVLLKYKEDGANEERREFNGILRDRLMVGQNGIQCKKYLTITVSAISYETANTRFMNYETHLNFCTQKLGTEIIPLKANERVRIIKDIFRGVNTDLTFITRAEFARRSEKMLCCPDYFEFKKDYFLFDDKYARCLYISKLPSSIQDTVFKEFIETNQSMIITKNVEFIDTADAIEYVRKQITNMKQEEITKTRAAAQAAKGAFIDPIEGTELAEDKAQAHELLQDIQGRNQKMTLCSFIIMITADSYEELLQNTETLTIIARKNQLTLSTAPYRQEQALASVLPLGNSNSADKEKSLQVRRTLSSESTAVFCPFNVMDFVHEGGLYYGINQQSKSIILFDRRKLSNPNGFIFGVPGAGKGVTAKLEIIYSILATDDEILILDPEREYTMLAELFGGEVIRISQSSQTHINPLDLIENPDPINEPDYDSVKEKLDFMLSFFSSILGDKEIEPQQRTVIDMVMKRVYEKWEKPTLKEYYALLENFKEEFKEEYGEQTHFSDIFKHVATLRDTLRLYVHGSMSVFSNPSNVNINKRIVVYDIKDLEKSLQTLGMTIVLENLWGRIAQNRSRGINTRIYIDEMYLMFKSEQCADFFRVLYKRARKWGGIPTGITQNVDDLLQSPIARTMLSNTKFVIMLSQNSTDSEVLSEVLKIPQETMSYVTNSGVGRGLIYAGEYGCIPFDNRFPTDGKLYKIVSTAFGEDHEATRAEIRANNAEKEELEKVPNLVQNDEDAVNAVQKEIQELFKDELDIEVGVKTPEVV